MTSEPSRTDAHECPTVGGASPARSDPTSEPTAVLEVGQRVVQPAAAEGSVRVPGYEVEAELGRGGMGVVYKARQVVLDRVVALKMILSGPHASPQDLARFRLEAEAAARLQHPNIVSIYEIGEHAGLPFFSLEFCGAGSLADKLDGTPWPGKQAAELVRTLAEAIQAAHSRNIVHRDLKPANVLLSVATGGSPVAVEDDRRAACHYDGVPKIADFGLAKKVGGAAHLTESGAILGTPSYMSPEQATGKGLQVGPPADIYALGAILYELLTGRPPFRGPTALDTLMQVVELEPAPPRLLNPGVPRDLETICLKCLEKRPDHRYHHAADLAADLGRFLRGESISIRSVNVLDRLARTLERSQLDEEFHAWGTLLWLWAAVVLVTHLVSTTVILTTGSHLVNWACYLGQFLAMGLIYLWHRRHAPARSTSAAEWNLWSLWTGYVIACFTIPLVTLQIPLFHNPQLTWASYPMSALLTGLAFFSMGSSYWGRCYLYGMTFFALAVAMPWNLNWASLAFGGLWSAVLFDIGWHLRRLGSKKT